MIAHPAALCAYRSESKAAFEAIQRRKTLRLYRDLVDKQFLKGVCNPFNDTTLQVQFTGGILAPHPSTNIKDWQAVFSEQDQPSQKSWKEQLMSGFLNLMFGLVPSQGMSQETGEVAFTIKRSPKGLL